MVITPRPTRLRVRRHGDVDASKIAVLGLWPPAQSKLWMTVNRGFNVQNEQVTTVEVDDSSTIKTDPRQGKRASPCSYRAHVCALSTAARR